MNRFYAFLWMTLCVLMGIVAVPAHADETIDDNPNTTFTITIKADASVLNARLGERLLPFDYARLAWEVVLDDTNTDDLEVRINDGAYDYVITNVTSSDGYRMEGFTEGYFTLTAEQMAAMGNETITITTEARPAILSVVVNGNPSWVSITDFNSGDVKNLHGTESEIYFNPDGGNQFIVQATSAANPIKNIEIDGGGSVEKQGPRWIVTAMDGDMITISFGVSEAKSVPVTFSFTNPGTDDVVAYVWGATDDGNGDYTAMVGDYVTVGFNTTSYSLGSVTCNGKSVTANPCNLLVPDEGLAFVISATPLAAKTITVNVNGDPEGVLFSMGYDANVVDLTEATNTVTIPAGYSEICILARAGYKIDDITCGSEHLTPGSLITISNGDVYNITVSSLVRDRSMLLFIEDVKWTFLEAAFNKNTTDQVTFLMGDGLTTGYQTLNYTAGEPLSISGYPTPVVMINNVAVSDNMNITDLGPCDVVKVFSTTPKAYNVTYEFDEIDHFDDMDITHDRVRPIVTPSTHKEFKGTEISFHFPQIDGGRFTFTANDEPMEMDENGYFHHTVTGNVTLKANFVADDKPDPEPEPEPDGIESIFIDGSINPDAEIYNLRGARMHGTNLPAGIYVSRGVKIIIK